MVINNDKKYIKILFFNQAVSTFEYNLTLFTQYII